ncbi:MAG: 3-methylaspartate ammonia-lyase [Caulobacter sp.]|jgi:hypothetical protein|nr:3-methylaspartate ammonia-lyase [Caulobacter sp.]
MAEFTPVKIYTPVGSLGVGLLPEEVEIAMARRPDAIAMDAGSTDSGAAYLAKGVSKNNYGAVKADLQLLMAAQAKADRKIPILIGTCGQAGGDLNVDWTRDIVLEVAREIGYAPKIALLYSEQTPQLIKAKLAQGKVTNLPPLGDLDEETIDACLHIVALMGPEPYFAALEAGADIILGGRSSDPAVIAAYPLWKGAPAGPSWHAGKVSECGGQALAGGTGQRGVIFEVHANGFDIEPVGPQFKATVNSISAHLLYENKDPWRLTEPGGELDVTGSQYHQLTDSKVRVTGSVWHPKPYTMKLEGASGRQFQTIMMIGITDPDVLAEPQVFHDRMVQVLNDRARKAVGVKDGEFDISIRMYGWNGVSGVAPPADTPRPRELGVLCVITAGTQETASQIAKACNAYFFHMPIRDGLELPSYGMIFSPADVDRGPVYQFELNHVVHVDSPMELVRMEILDGAAAKSEQKTHA